VPPPTMVTLLPHCLAPLMISQIATCILAGIACLDAQWSNPLSQALLKLTPPPSPRATCVLSYSEETIASPEEATSCRWCGTAEHPGLPCGRHCHWQHRELPRGDHPHPAVLNHQHHPRLQLHGLSDHLGHHRRAEQALWRAPAQVPPHKRQRLRPGQRRVHWCAAPPPPLLKQAPSCFSIHLDLLKLEAEIFLQVFCKPMSVREGEGGSFFNAESAKCCVRLHRSGGSICADLDFACAAFVPAASPAQVLKAVTLGSPSGSGGGFFPNNLNGNVKN